MTRERTRRIEAPKPDSPEIALHAKAEGMAAETAKANPIGTALVALLVSAWRGARDHAARKPTTDQG